MKTVATVIFMACVVALVQSGPQEVTMKLLNFAQACQEKVGASTDDMANLIKKEPPTTKEGKCLIACVWQSVGSLDSNGKFKKEGAMAISKEITNNDPEHMKIAEEIVNSCAGISVSDDT